MADALSDILRNRVKEKLARDEVVASMTVRLTRTIEIAQIAADVNQRTHDIGARRLHTVLERLLDDLLYNAPDIGKQTIPITQGYVRERLGALVADEDLARYIL